MSAQNGNNPDKKHDCMDLILSYFGHEIPARSQWVGETGIVIQNNSDRDVIVQIFEKEGEDGENGEDDTGAGSAPAAG